MLTPPTKIVVTGTESTGKTTLSQALATRLGESYWLPEWARQHLDWLAACGQTGYSPQDVEQIARFQLHWEDTLLPKVHRYLVCDTDLITCKIWLEFKFQYCPTWITQAIAQRAYGLHILCDIDIPWVFDPLRENPHQRDTLHRLYLQTLHTLHKPFLLVSGSLEQRLAQVLKHLEQDSD